MASRDHVLKRAFTDLYPDTKRLPEMDLSYSSRFNAYNANVRVSKHRTGKKAFQFNLSRSFEDCEDDILIGVLQHLLNRVFKTRVETLEQELYESFLRNVTRYASREKSDPLLAELFGELNEEYFNDLLEEPSLVFGSKATTTLGHYNFTLDRVTISSALKPRRDLIKYVLYHELLHKKHSFEASFSRTRYHTKAFRDDEKAYHDKDIEKKLESFLRSSKRKRAFKTLLDWK